MKSQYKLCPAPSKHFYTDVLLQSDSLCCQTSYQQFAWGFMELNMKHSFFSRCLEPKAHKSCREIKTGTWENERHEIMYHFIWTATHQRGAISKDSETNLCDSKDWLSCFAEGWHARAMNTVNGFSHLGTAYPEGPHFLQEMAVRFASCY